MTIPNVTLGEDIQPSWGNAVADSLNGLVTDDAGTRFRGFGTTDPTTDLQIGDVYFLEA